MTRQELLNLEHLAVAEVTKFVHIHTEDGWYMTDWDGGNIKEYSGSVCYYMPIRDTYPDYRVITAEEHEELMKRQEEVIKLEENNATVNE